MTNSTQIDGTTYLLATWGKNEWVSRYSQGDMAEIFTIDEIAGLEEGKAISKTTRGDTIIYRDMVAATRAANA